MATNCNWNLSNVLGISLQLQINCTSYRIGISYIVCEICRAQINVICAAIELVK